MPKPYMNYNVFPKINYNKLHKHSFCGDLVKLNEDLKTFNVYQRSANLATPLFFALAHKNDRVIDAVMSIYETDLHFVETNLPVSVGKQYAMTADVDQFWTKKPILIGYGREQCAMVEEFYKQYQIIETTDAEFDVTKCVVILLKVDNFNPARVICVAPKTKVEIELTIKMMNCVIPNGFLDLNAAVSWGDSLLDVAAFNGLSEFIFRLVNLGADCDVERLAKSACKNGQLELLKALHGRFNFSYDILLEDRDEFLFLISHGEWSTFEHIVDQVIQGKTRNYDHAHIWEEISKLQLPISKENILHFALECNQFEFIQTCLTDSPNLKFPNKIGDIPIHEAIHHESCKMIVMKMIDIDSSILDIEDSNEKNPLHLMAEANWEAELCQIYSKFPKCSKIFFKNKQIGTGVLHYVINLKYFSLAKFIVEQSKDELNEESFKLILLAAVTENCGDLLKYLLAVHEYDLSVPRNSDINPFIAALRYQQVDNFFILVEKFTGDLTNLKDEYGNNLLRYAIWEKYPIYNSGDMYNVQINYGDDSDEDVETSIKTSQVSNYDPYEISELDVYRKEKMVEIFDDLVKRGVDYHNVNASQRNLVYYAVAAKNLEIVKRLIALKVDTILDDGRGFLPIHFCQDLDIFKELHAIENVINTKPTKQGDTLLHMALIMADDRKPNVELIRFILENGANVAAKGESGRSPLHIVNDIDLCKLLLEFGADVNAVDEFGNTVIHFALQKSNYEIVKVLMECVDKLADGYLPLNMYGESILCGFVKQYGQEDAIYKLFSEIFKTDAFQTLVHRYCNNRNEMGTPIIIDAVTMNKYIFNELVKQPNIDLTVREPSSGDTALHVAASSGRTEIAKILLDREIDVDILNNQNETPLAQASRYMVINKSIFSMFIKYGANLNVKLAEDVPLVVQVVINSYEGDVFCEMLANGADYSVKHPDGRTIFEAMNSEMKKVFAFLE